MSTLSSKSKQKSPLEAIANDARSISSDVDYAVLLSGVKERLFSTPIKPLEVDERGIIVEDHEPQNKS